MYEQYFGLTEKPFSIQPDPAFLYWGRTHRLAYAMLEYGVLNHAGISVITGEVGCGKTTLIHRLLDQLSDTHTIALLSNIQAGRGDLLSWVLMGFGEEFAGKSHVELFSQLQDFFIREYSKGRRVVLIIDEAQNLSADMLEELRMLSNINAGKDQLLQLILVGQPQLKDILNRPELLQLAQRIGADFHITPLNREEVHAYLDTRLSIAGAKAPIFTDAAMDYISEQSRGVPRVINVIADTALVYAFSSEDDQVDVATVESVVRDKLEFGVFGIASDEMTAAPLPSGDNSSVDAFAAPKKSEPVPTKAAAAPKKPERVKERGDAKKKSLGGDDNAAQPTKHSQIKTVAPTEQQETSPSSFAENIDYEKTPSPTLPDETVQSADISGVVVVGVKGQAPNDAILSAHADQKVIYAAYGDDDPYREGARTLGAVVVEAPARQDITLGRIRNAAYRQLKQIEPRLDYVQFVQAGDELASDWFSAAERFLRRRPEVAILEGGVVDADGQMAVGTFTNGERDSESTGELQSASAQSFIVRASAFEAIGGFRGDLPAGDIDDLCLRFRRRGARVWRINTQMASASSTGTTSRDGWRRAVKSGYENAVLAKLYGSSPERFRLGAVLSSVFWGGVAPMIALGGALLAGVGTIALDMRTSPILAGGAVIGIAAFIYLMAISAAAVRRGVQHPSAWIAGAGAVGGHVPRLLGAIRYWRGKSL